MAVRRVRIATTLPPAMFEIGSSLREARMRQGLDFEEMEERTKVRKKYLRHLEDENFDQLPGHTYTKGFLQVYADALGLDGRLYVEEYNSRYVAGDDEAAARACPAPRRAHSRRRERRESGRVGNRPRGDPPRHGARDRCVAVRRARHPEGRRGQLDRGRRRRQP